MRFVSSKVNPREMDWDVRIGDIMVISFHCQSKQSLAASRYLRQSTKIRSYLVSVGVCRTNEINAVFSSCAVQASWLAKHSSILRR